MALPRKVYVALNDATYGGIYYTENFHDPGGDPTWSAVNSGLASLVISNLQLDPFAPETRQYCVAAGVLYRREGGGAWESILTSAEAQVVTGVAKGTLAMCYCDAATDGTIWALMNDTTLVFGAPTKWGLISEDYGETWASHPLNSEGVYNYAVGGIAAHGDYVYIIVNDSYNAQAIHYSTNQGASFTRRSYGGSTFNSLRVELNPLVPGDAYGPGSGGVYRVRTGVATLIYGGLNSVYGISPPGGVMWFDPDDADHMRLLMEESVIITDDDWDTYSTLSIGGGAEMAVFAPYAEAHDSGLMIIGRSHNATSKVCVLDSEADTTLTSRSGNNYNTPPYTNAIPSVAGAVVSNGVQAILEQISSGPTVPPVGGTITPPGGSPVTLVGTGGFVQAVSMPGYTGNDRGAPMPGDRSAWDTIGYPDYHARDVRRAIPTLHNPQDAEVGEAPIWNGSKWVATDVVTATELAELTLNELADVDADAPDDGDALVYNSGDGEWEPVDVLTPTEHTAIGDDSPHHAAVTLGSGNDSSMASLSTQELTVALKDHDHSGDAGDGGQFDVANLSSAGADGQLLTADGAGGVAWENISDLPEINIGDVTAGDYIEINNDGEITLHGDARVYRTEWIKPGGFAVPGTKPASLVDWGISSAWEFSDSTDDTLYASLRIPQDMDKSDAPQFKIGWASATADPGDDSKQVYWQLEYLWVAQGEDTTAAAQETLHTIQSASTVANGLSVATITGIDLPSDSDQLLLMRIKRLGDDGDDDLGDDCVLLGCGLRYTSSVLGVMVGAEGQLLLETGDDIVTEAGDHLLQE
jgi:hypothetical protein